MKTRSGTQDAHDLGEAASRPGDFRSKSPTSCTSLVEMMALSVRQLQSSPNPPEVDHTFTGTVSARPKRVPCRKRPYGPYSA